MASTGVEAGQRTEGLLVVAGLDEREGWKMPVLWVGEIQVVSAEVRPA